MGLSTLVAFVLLGFFLAIRHGFAVGLTQEGADLLLLEPAGGSSSPTIAVLSAVSSFRGVRSAVGVSVEPMLFGAERHPLRVAGLSANAFLELSAVVRKGELPRGQAQRWLSDLTGALVTDEIARRNDWRLGEAITLHSMSRSSPRDLTFHIDGVLGKLRGVTPTSDVNLHLEYLRRWAHQDFIDFIFVQVRDAQRADAVARAIELKFANSATPLSTQSFKSLLQGMAERLADVNAMTSVVIVASLFGLFLICLCTLIHSVSERLGEFALLRAVGFSPLRLIWIVFLEALLVIVPAACAGTLCALVVIRVFAGEKLNLAGIVLTSAAVLECALIALGLAILSSVLPALQIMRMNCAQALRRG
ncbi:MAG TPA: FtsX-like permease family protein [Steroidobacteraceae bacterium]|nr:FtsX-like permease family protein [Steroidobacteraceae bacterium]